MFLKEICGGDGAVVKDSYSVVRSEPLRNLHLGAPKLLRTHFFQFLCSEMMYSNTRDPSGEQQRSRLMELPLLKLCNDILAHIEQSRVLGLHVGFGKREQTAQLDGMFTEEGL